MCSPQWAQLEPTGSPHAMNLLDSGYGACVYQGIGIAALVGITDAHIERRNAGTCFVDAL
jgi:hypothetical protein